MSICVVGAGIIGLSSAVEIQRREPRAKVTLVAEKFSPDTTSDIAAGIWRPIFLPDPRHDLIKRWGQVTIEHTIQLAHENAVLHGASFASGYEFSYKPFEDIYWDDLVRDFRFLTEKERRDMGYDSFNHCIFFTTTLLESGTYLKFLVKEFEKNGGKLMQKRLDSLQELSGYDCIVNCSGLGAGKLVNDKECFPIRGQVFRVDAPFMQHFWVFDDSYYTPFILPNQRSVVVGGTHQENDWNTQVSPTDGRWIWDGACKYLPSLKEAKILKEVVGLRPGRKTIRLEKDVMQISGKNTSVVHNYGHGGSGVTLFQGCAKDAANLAVQSIQGRNQSKL